MNTDYNLFPQQKVTYFRGDNYMTRWSEDRIPFYSSHCF